MHRALEMVPWPKRARRYLRYLAVRAAVTLVGALPIEAASRLGSTLGALAFAVARGERRKALASLARAFPLASEAERVDLGRRAFQHLGAAACELACVAQLDAQPEARVDWPPEDRAVLDRALARGKGVVFVTGHLGNWEVLARRMTLAGYPLTAIGKEASDPRTTALVADLRRRGGVGVLWRGAPGAARQMLRTLRSNGLLGILIDQDTRVQSVWVPFFGHPAKTPRAAADLVLRTGAAPVLGFALRTGRARYRLALQEVPLPGGDGEAAVVELTTRFNQGIEAFVRAHPEQWVWMHQRWKSPPPPAGEAGPADPA